MEELSETRELAALRKVLPLLEGQRESLVKRLAASTVAYEQRSEERFLHEIERLQDELKEIDGRIASTNDRILSLEAQLEKRGSEDGLSEFLPHSGDGRLSEHHNRWVTKAEEQVTQGQRTLSRFLTAALAASIGIILTLLDSTRLEWEASQQGLLLWGALMAFTGVVAGALWFLLDVIHGWRLKKLLLDFDDGLPVLELSLMDERHQLDRWIIIGSQAALWLAVTIVVMASFAVF